MGQKRTYTKLFSNLTSLVEDPTFVTGKSIIFELFHFIYMFSFVLGLDRLIQTNLQPTVV